MKSLLGEISNNFNVMVIIAVRLHFNKSFGLFTIETFNVLIISVECNYFCGNEDVLRFYSI